MACWQARSFPTYNYDLNSFSKFQDYDLPSWDAVAGFCPFDQARLKMHVLPHDQNKLKQQQLLLLQPDYWSWSSWTCWRASLRFFSNNKLPPHFLLLPYFRFVCVCSRTLRGCRMCFWQNGGELVQVSLNESACCGSLSLSLIITAQLIAV